MADTNQNLVNFRLTGTLSTTWTEVKVSNDIIRDTAIDITDASITLTNEARTSFELVVWTIAWWVLTLSKRWITEAQTQTENASYKKEWRPWAIWYVTLFASDTLDIDVAWWTATIKNDITFTGDNTFSGLNTFVKWIITQEWIISTTFITTSDRDTALGWDWVALYPYTWILAWGVFWNYNTSTWLWESIDTWTTTPNATLIATWKVRLWSTAQSKAWTDDDGWEPLVVRPSDIANNNQSNTFKYWVDAEINDTYVIALTPALTAYTVWQDIIFRPNTANTWACTININWLWVISIKLIDWTDPLNWDFATWVDYTLRYDWTNFVLQQVPIRATSSEVNDWTNVSKYITPKDAKDNYLVSASAWTTLTLTYSTEQVWVSKNITIYTKLKEHKITWDWWWFTVKFWLRAGSGGWAPVFWKIYKNGVAIWTERSNSSSTDVYFSENFTFAKDDLVQLYLKSSISYEAYSNLFTITYNPVFSRINWSIIL